MSVELINEFENKVRRGLNLVSLIAKSSRTTVFGGLATVSVSGYNYRIQEVPKIKKPILSIASDSNVFESDPLLEFNSEPYEVSSGIFSPVKAFISRYFGVPAMLIKADYEISDPKKSESLSNLLDRCSVEFSIKFSTEEISALKTFMDLALLIQKKA